MHILFFQKICFKVNLSFQGIEHSWFYRILVPNPPHAPTSQQTSSSYQRKGPIQFLCQRLLTLCHGCSTKSHPSTAFTPASLFLCSSCTEHPSSDSLFLSHWHHVFFLIISCRCGLVYFCIILFYILAFIL